MQRLDSYYKRNYKDYFEFVEGSLNGKEGQQLTESEKGILDWLKSNKWNDISNYFSKLYNKLLKNVLGNNKFFLSSTHVLWFQTNISR